MSVRAFGMLEAFADAISQLERLSIIQGNRAGDMLQMSVCGCSVAASLSYNESANTFEDPETHSKNRALINRVMGLFDVGECNSSLFW